MTFKALPIIGGFIVLVSGVGLIALFAPNDQLIGYTQVSSGTLAIAVGLYLILVVSWQEPQSNDPRTPKLYTLIRREVRGRALRTVTSATAISVLVGALFATMLLTNGAAYSVESTRDKLGADLIVIPRQVPISSQPFYTLTYAGTSSVSGELAPSKHKSTLDYESYNIGIFGAILGHHSNPRGSLLRN